MKRDTIYSYHMGSSSFSRDADQKKEVDYARCAKEIDNRICEKTNIMVLEIADYGSTSKYKKTRLAFYEVDGVKNVKSQKRDHTELSLTPIFSIIQNVGVVEYNQVNKLKSKYNPRMFNFSLYFPGGLGDNKEAYLITDSDDENIVKYKGIHYKKEFYSDKKLLVLKSLNSKERKVLEQNNFKSNFNTSYYVDELNDSDYYEFISTTDELNARYLVIIKKS
jgi:hypothetical protein